MDTPQIPAQVRLAALEEQILRAARDAGRKREDIHLIGVSKTVDAGAIRSFLEAGLYDFGENYPQEAAQKWTALKKKFPKARLHFIGKLQSRKVEEVVRLCDVLHTLDREKNARLLCAEKQKGNTLPTLFIQVNTGREPQKGGVLPENLPTFLALCRETYRLDIAGLMCIPPFDQHPAPHFAFLAQLAQEHTLPYLSMGMSADFDQAIRFGATHIRVGSALFGERKVNDE